MVTRRTVLLSPMLALPVSLSKEALASSMEKPQRTGLDYPAPAPVSDSATESTTASFTVIAILLEPGDVIAEMIDWPSKGNPAPKFCLVSAPGLIKKAGYFVEELFKAGSLDTERDIELNFYNHNDQVWALRPDLDPNDRLILNGPTMFRFMGKNSRYDMFERALQFRLGQYMGWFPKAAGPLWRDTANTRELQRKELAHQVTSAVLKVPLKPQA
jgi:hypothetical protein